jgi:hypothetical protein
MKKYICLIGYLLMVGCSTVSSFQYPPARWLRDSDTTPIKMPKVKSTYKYSQTQFGQLSASAVDVLQFTQGVASMPTEWAFSGRMESVNANNFDEVADSTWFTNRIGRTSQFENNFKTPPSMKGKWQVMAVTESKAPQEFVIQDANRNHYVIKIDTDPEWLVSGGEMLGALILSAAGYNVTENYILDFDSRILDKPILPDGKYHALAVRVPPGEQLGRFEFQGKRKDDPNDRISHEYRREVCALRVFASLLNNKDVSTRNNLDVYRNGYVTHYLSNLSAPLANMRSEFLSGANTTEGHTIDALFSFGFYNPYWTSADAPVTEYKGAISSEKFNPKKWRPDQQNLAFKYMSYRDAFWASKILRQFSNDDMQTIVALSGYKDTQTRDRVATEIMIRRDKIILYWFQKINPLDNFRLGNGLEFDDIDVPPGTHYRFRIREASGREFGKWQETTARALPLPDNIQNMIVIQIQTLRDPKREKWSPSVDVYIETKNGPAILGIHRRYFH